MLSCHHPLLLMRQNIPDGCIIPCYPQNIQFPAPTVSVPPDHHFWHCLYIFTVTPNPCSTAPPNYTSPPSHLAPSASLPPYQRSGFIQAFIIFWITYHKNNCTKEDLQVAAEGLLKGCQEHYRAGVTRISTMARVIPPENSNTFKARALGLLYLSTSNEFVHQSSLLVHDFLRLKLWMEWWACPSHAAMLFN